MAHPYKEELGIPLLEIEKELAKERQLSGKTLGPNDPKGRARDIVSEKTGLSSRTFERAKKIIESNEESHNQLGSHDPKRYSSKISRI